MDSDEIMLELSDVLSKSLAKYAIPDPKGLNITNTCKLLTDQQIRDCIELLGPEYTSLNGEIMLHKSRFRLLMAYLNGDSVGDDDVLRGVFMRNITGFQNQAYKRIELFPFVYYAKKDVKIRVIDCLYHELRHLWQGTHDDDYSENYVQMDVSPLGYAMNKIEIDANDFAFEMVNSHREQLNEILKIDDSWRLGNMNYQDVYKKLAENSATWWKRTKYHVRELIVDAFTSFMHLIKLVAFY